MSGARIGLLLVFILCGVFSTYAQFDCEPPPTTLKTNDWGNGIGDAVAVIWDATNGCPNTIYLRQYTLDNGLNWYFPDTLGNARGAYDPETMTFEAYWKFFFFLPTQTNFLTRAIPYDNPLPPTAPLLESNLGYTLLLPDGGEIKLLAAALPEPKPGKKRRGNSRTEHFR